LLKETTGMGLEPTTSALRVRGAAPYLIQFYQVYVKTATTRILILLDCFHY